MTVRRRVLVEGLVQGVWFRDSCRRAAERVGVGGWIANLPDGRVEAVFEGPSEAVDELVDWCRIGPPRARVDRVEVVDEEADGSFRSFEVL